MTQFVPENDSYDAHARSCAPDDLWGQVKRTVHGKPLPAAQIDMILENVQAMLELNASDVLLDLCCGNGALTHHWFAACANGIGVDASPCLIDIARSRFGEGEPDRFVLAEAVSYLESPQCRSDFTKAVCYGSLQYFSAGRAAELLTALRRLCPTLRRVVIGNIPDRDRAAAFFGAKLPDTEELDSPLTPTGVWHSAQGFTELARRSGWRCRTQSMPADFHAAHYRFDAILTTLEENSR